MKLQNPHKTICFILAGIIAVLLALLVFYFQTTFTVTFDTKGGTIYQSIEVKPNSVVTPPADPVMAGFIFDGWFLEGEDKEYDFSSKIVGDTVIIAKWKPIL